jgi:phosphodiesterase/alkaline phosphatase D-like protein
MLRFGKGGLVKNRLLLLSVLLVSMVLALSTACTCGGENLCVTTLPVGAHTASGATLVGKLKDGRSTQVGFNFWKTDVYMEEQNPAVLTSGEAVTGTKSFYYDVGNLQPGTSYSYRAWARESDGDKIFGDKVSFMTEGQNTSPTLATGGTSNLTSSSVTLHGEVVSQGSASNLMVEIQVGTTSGSLGSIYPVAGTIQAPGAFSVDLSGLSPDTTYYYRAAGSSINVVVSPGEEKSFKTLE